MDAYIRRRRSMCRTRRSLDLSASVTVKKKTPPSISRDDIVTWWDEISIFGFAWKARVGTALRAFGHPTVRWLLLLHPAPRRHPALEAVDQVGDGDAEHRQHDDRHEQLGGGEGVAVEHHHVAEARERGEHLGHHHADQRAPEPDPDAGDEERHRGVQDDAPE